MADSKLYTKDSIESPIYKILFIPIANGKSIITLTSLVKK